MGWIIPRKVYRDRNRRGFHKLVKVAQIMSETAHKRLKVVHEFLRGAQNAFFLPIYPLCQTTPN